MQKITRNLRLVLYTALATLSSCTSSNLYQEGFVEQREYIQSISFTTAKWVVLVPAKVGDTEKNFILDTGAEASVIQSDTLIGKKEKVTGASKRSVTLGKKTLPELTVGSISYKNTAAFYGDLQGLKEQIPNFGGLIGQPIISKSVWIIDYPKKELTISNSSNEDSTFKNLNATIENGRPYVYISFSGKQFKALLDLGSNSSISIPPSSPLAKLVEAQVTLRNNVRESYTLGGNQQINEKIGIASQVNIGDATFTNVEVDIRPSSTLRVGMQLFSKAKLCIDGPKGSYKVSM